MSRSRGFNGNVQGRVSKINVLGGGGGGGVYGVEALCPGGIP